MAAWLMDNQSTIKNMSNYNISNTKMPLLTMQNDFNTTRWCHNSQTIRLGWELFPILITKLDTLEEWELLICIKFSRKAIKRLWYLGYLSPQTIMSPLELVCGHILVVAAKFSMVDFIDNAYTTYENNYMILCCNAGYDFIWNT